MEMMRPHLSNHNGPQQKLIITQQTCLVEEKFSKNGVQKDVHVVVKNNPFVINLALLDKQFNFHNLSTEIQLVYDCPTLKEVDFVKLKPLECKMRPNEEGDQLTVEIRIKVLTSQLEDMFFRVVLKLVDPRTRKDYSQLVVLSHPIRVVSKPDQVKKKIKKRKRAPTDSLLDSIGRIEYQQREQQRLLKRLCRAEFGPDAVSPDMPSDYAPLPHPSPADDEDSSEEVVAEEKDDFRSAFSDFLVAFKQLQSIDTSDGSYKINTSAQDAQTMCEILELIRTEMKQGKQEGEPTADEPHSADSPCACAHCPYKEKMEKITSSLFSAVPDTSVSSHIPIMPQAPLSDSQAVSGNPVVSTDMIDGAMGGLFDMNAFAQLQGLNSLGLSSMMGASGNLSNFNFTPATFGEFNPLAMFTPQAMM